MGLFSSIILLYTSIVAITAPSPVFYTESTNPAFKNPLSIDPNILYNVCLDPSGIQNTLKCLVNLSVNSFRPPPGLAPEHINVVSSTFFHSRVSLSYKPFLSTNNLSNSIGG